jgi:general secretion pathway protein A
MMTKTKTLDKEAPPLDLAIKALWGASTVPFGAACSQPYQTETYQDLRHRLLQMLGLRTCGVLTGPNGVGKSYLVGQLLESLPEKAWQVHYLSHATFTGSDLLRTLCRQAGIAPRMSRSDNVAALDSHWQELGSRQAVLILEEAQQVGAGALEEIRLLTCARRDTRQPFSLLFVGDDTLLARLRMAVNRPLLSRLAFSLRLGPLSPSEAAGYLEARLRAAGIHGEPFEAAAVELIVAAAEGLPRQLNHLAGRSLENAVREQSAVIGVTHVHQALEQLPWLAPLPGEA